MELIGFKMDCPSFLSLISSLPHDVLCDPIDVIWRKGTQLMLSLVTQFSDGLLVEIFRDFPIRQVNVMNYVQSLRFHLVVTFLTRQSRLK